MLHYREYLDPVTGQTQQYCTLTGENPVCILDPYPTSNILQIKRATARRVGSTYAPDFLGLMEVALINSWQVHQIFNCLHFHDLVVVCCYMLSVYGFSDAQCDKIRIYVHTLRHTLHYPLITTQSHDIYQSIALYLTLKLVFTESLREGRTIKFPTSIPLRF